MRQIKAPLGYERQWGEQVLFLAGSIEMGAAEDWQERVISTLCDKPVLILNPRRDDWDSSWVQAASNPQFREQVEWELAGLEYADMVLMYFSPGTKSPISLLEFGLLAVTGKLLVICPDGFWRKGNVEVVCHRFAIPLYETIDEALGMLRF